MDWDVGLRSPLRGTSGPAAHGIGMHEATYSPKGTDTVEVHKLQAVSGIR